MPIDQGIKVHIGALDLWIRRKKTEWLLASSIQADANPGDNRVVALQSPVIFPDDLEIARFACREVESPSLHLRPALADRHIVSRPAMRFRLLTKESIDIYIGTPMWLQVTDGNRILCDLPTRPLKSTWFGPDTRTGRLCYATQTAARVEIDKVLGKPSWVVTKVTIVNKTNHLFQFDRLNIPTPSLDLYAGEDGTLWTEDITLVHDNDQMASIQLTGKCPSHAANAVLVTPARQPAPKSILIRAVQQLRSEL